MGPVVGAVVGGVAGALVAGAAQLVDKVLEVKHDRKEKLLGKAMEKTAHRGMPPQWSLSNGAPEFCNSLAGLGADSEDEHRAIRR